jgi:hypothetical protein
MQFAALISFLEKATLQVQPNLNHPHKTRDTKKMLSQSMIIEEKGLE